MTDQGGLPVPGATVTAAAEDAATTRVAVTDTRGLAELAALNPSARYVVTVELQGFQTSRQEDFLGRAGQTASTAVTLTVGNVTDTVVVTVASPVVDVTSAVVAEDITLALTEAVPTAGPTRAICSWCLACFRTTRNRPGTPASKSGLNYSDIGGNTSVSRDNFYYIDGINVTDGVERYLRRQPEHRDHPGAAGPDRRHPRRVCRRPWPAVQRHHEVRDQPVQRLGELLLPERRPRRREPHRHRPEVLALRRGRHRRGDDGRQRGVVLWQLPPPGAQ